MINISFINKFLERTTNILCGFDETHNHTLAAKAWYKLSKRLQPVTTGIKLSSNYLKLFYKSLNLKTTYGWEEQDLFFLETQILCL